MKRQMMTAAVMGFTGVALGAFGAHGLKRVVEPELLAVFETGVRYQMYHTFALVAALFVGSMNGSPKAAQAGWFFIAGTVIFSGSLYLLSLTGLRSLGMVTPVGGVCFLIGWYLLLRAAMELKRD